METKKRPLDLTMEECHEFNFSDLGGRGRKTYVWGTSREIDAEVYFNIRLGNWVVKSRVGMQ